MLKIFTSSLRDSMYDFLKQNNYIESEIQKGFTSKISGTLEHTSMMGHIINKARTKQRSLIVTLLDLKNAFGEVHHNLISSVLSYHHIPDGIQSLVTNLYTDFKTSIITNQFSTPAIPVHRGVLQGDCLSPLLFNMCFNTFIQFIKAEKFKQLGFSDHDGTNHLFNPAHWFQFADDAAVISSSERENQLLLNCFTRWCQWAQMIIRVDKCTTFGIKKFSTCSMQFQPKLLINNELVPPIQKGASFRYLGRHFNFEMNNDEHMSSLKTSFSNLLSDIDSLPILPQNKLRLYQTYLLSKASWDFTVSNISKTWVIQNLDNIVSRYIREWLELPISATLSGLILSKNQFGLSLQLPSMKFLQCQAVQRNILKLSLNENVRSLWKTTCEGSNIQYDLYRNTKEVLKAVRTEHTKRLQHELTSQGAILSFMIDNSLIMANSIWSDVQSNMPRNIFNFTVRYLNNSLANRKNLARWNLSQTSDCSFCFHPESLLHVVAGCKTYLDEGRFTWRHNSALKFIANSFQSIVGSTLYVDLPGFLSPCIISGDTFRPDILLVTKDKKLFVLELTVGFETNLNINPFVPTAPY